ncbi:MAG: oligosaccharide flippase family protein [Clostridia bacterium]|nr:oligosaccharide flippase family protein [Clostridia bacterium]
MNKKKLLLKNTFMLYLLTFSSYFFSFISVPYQTRVLGPDLYGRLGFAAAFVAYFQLLIDFGFLLSATEDISSHREDKHYVSKTLTSVVCIKIAFSALSMAVVLGLCSFVPKFSEDPMLYILYIVMTIVNAMLPDFVYRGLEQMTAITVRTVLIRLFFTVMIFVFLREASDYYIVPILNIIGGIGALAGVYYHLSKKMDIHLIKPDFKDVVRCFKRSSTFFYSRIATTVYGSTNTFILNLICGDGITGLYTSADKLVSTAKSAASPISDSLYPYMMKNKDFKTVRKVLSLIMPVIFLGCTVVFIFAEPLCVWLFGAEFAGTGNVLRALMPSVLFILPNYILGFPTLGAMGLSKYANYSIIAGTIVHIVGLTVIALCGWFSVISVAIMTSITEFVILLYRAFMIWKNRKVFSASAAE